MTILRLIADDLTGALDTAAEFAGVTGPVAVRWSLPDGAQGEGSGALDSGTREMARDQAVARVSAMAPLLVGADIAFKKVDSLLRGHVMDELTACWRLGLWDHCVIAPAFPYQGRVTRGGVQFRRLPGGEWSAVDDVFARAEQGGLHPRRGEISQPLASGVHIVDAETDADLSRIAALGRALGGRVLWCGSAGLAQALVGRPAKALRSLPQLILGLFGSDQPVTARQLAACGDLWTMVEAGDPQGAGRLAARLHRDGAVLASFALPEGLARDEAARRILAGLRSLLPGLPRPGALLAAGGETLRAICDIVGASHLEASGQIEPGLPRSILRGGAWDGVCVVSKSGAFGADQLWSELLRSNGFHIERIEA